MKRKSVIGLVVMILMIAHQSIQAQTGDVKTKASVIQPFYLSISSSKTTNLIFPYAIKSIDRGSKRVLVQKAKAAENVLQVKADTVDFKETNLSIITQDGQFYSFMVSYAENPTWLNLQISKDSGLEKQAIFQEPIINKALYDRNVDTISLQQQFLNKCKSSNKIILSLLGIYLKDNILFFALSVENLSLFNLTIENIEFIVKDRKSSKRSAVYEKLFQPLFDPFIPTLDANDKRYIITGFQPFTFFPSQVLHIKLREKNGGRSVIMPIKLKKLLKARAIR
jgi:conjugative transposon TraN protein